MAKRKKYYLRLEAVGSLEPPEAELARCYRLLLTAFWIGVAVVVVACTLFPEEIRRYPGWAVLGGVAIFVTPALLGNWRLRRAGINGHEWRAYVQGRPFMVIMQIALLCFLIRRAYQLFTGQL